MDHRHGDLRTWHLGWGLLSCPRETGCVQGSWGHPGCRSENNGGSLEGEGEVCRTRIVSVDKDLRRGQLENESLRTSLSG